VTRDPKPDAKVRDPDLLRRLHSEWRECVLCEQHRGRLSLHHVHKHPRSDVRANLVMLCGDGVSGCHGLVEAGDRSTRAALGTYLLRERPDTVAYIARVTGGAEQGRAWMERNLGNPLAA
jgi:hypothetical protein